MCDACNFVGTQGYERECLRHWQGQRKTIFCSLARQGLGIEPDSPPGLLFFRSPWSAAREPWSTAALVTSTVWNKITGDTSRTQVTLCLMSVAGQKGHSKACHSAFLCFHYYTSITAWTAKHFCPVVLTTYSPLSECVWLLRTADYKDQTSTEAWSRAQIVQLHGHRESFLLSPFCSSLFPHPKLLEIQNSY